MAAVFSGCSHVPLQSRVIFANAAINGRPVRLAIDTGASMNWLYSSEAGRLGLRSTPIQPADAAAETPKGLSEPVNIVVDAQTYTAPFATIGVPWIARALSRLAGVQDVAGSFGWPALRDGILVFDASHHTVSSVEKIPADAAGWLKLKLKPDRNDGLFVEITMKDGAVRTFLVDTGDPGGITLSPALWQEWRATHPHARTTTGFSWFLGRTRLERREVTQVGEIQLGPLTITRVSVCRQTAYESGMNLHDGTLGLQALEHLNLIVDGRHGVAYARPKPAGAPAPRPEHRDWIAGESVRLNVAPQFVFAASTRRQIGDPAGAVADFTRALELEPGNAEIYFERGVAKENSGDHDGAIADASCALEIEPKRVSLYSLRGAARLNKAELDGAIGDFDRAIALDPQNASAHLFRGMARLGKGDAAGAIADLDRVLALDPSNPSPYGIRGVARLARQDFRGAIADLDRGVESDPKNASLHAARGAARFETADRGGAAADFRQAFELDPKTSSGGLAAGDALQMQGDDTDALAQYDKAVALNVSDAVDAAWRRQLLLRRLGRPADAFAKIAAGWKDRWKLALARYLTDGLDENGLLAEAGRGEKSEQATRECDACYCIGAMRLVHGDHSGAREFWQRCGAPAYAGLVTAKLAGEELARLDERNPAG